MSLAMFLPGINCKWTGSFMCLKKKRSGFKKSFRSLRWKKKGGPLICTLLTTNCPRLLKRQNQEYKTVLVVGPNVKNTVRFQMGLDTFRNILKIWGRSLIWNVAPGSRGATRKGDLREREEFKQHKRSSMVRGETRSTYLVPGARFDFYSLTSLSVSALLLHHRSPKKKNYGALWRNRRSQLFKNSTLL